MQFSKSHDTPPYCICRKIVGMSDSTSDLPSGPASLRQQVAVQKEAHELSGIESHCGSSRNPVIRAVAVAKKTLEVLVNKVLDLAFGEVG